MTLFGHYHCFTDSRHSFHKKTGGRLSIVLASFPARIARGKPYFYIILLWLFGQVHPILFQWDLSLLIALTKISVEGRAVPLCIECISGWVYQHTLGDYLAWIQILDQQAILQMGSCDAAVCYDSWFDSACLSPGVNPRFCNWQKPLPHNRASSMLYGWCDTGCCSSFTNSLLHIDSPI